MNKFNDCCEKHLFFLSKLGYNATYSHKDMSFGFIGGGVAVYEKDLYKIKILYAPEVNEIACIFQREKDIVKLEEMLEFLEIAECSQYMVQPDLEKEIVDIAKKVKLIFAKTDFTAGKNFEKTFNFAKRQREQNAREYGANHKRERDMKSAGGYWNNKRYLKARNLYCEHYAYLSKAQLKRLKFINNLNFFNIPTYISQYDLNYFQKEFFKALAKAQLQAVEKTITETEIKDDPIYEYLETRFFEYATNAVFGLLRYYDDDYEKIMLIDKKSKTNLKEDYIQLHDVAADFLR